MALDATATNVSPGFKKYLFAFPLGSPALLTGVSGTLSISSHGQNFSEALISLHDIPPGQPLPKDGEVYDTYEQVNTRYASMRYIVQDILKEPGGTGDFTLPIDLQLPVGIPVSGHLIVILDGSVLRSGGAFTMSCHLTAHLAAASGPTAGPIALDDEFCFQRKSGGERAVDRSSPQTAFARVVPITQKGQLLALYGDVSDSAFGPNFGAPIGDGDWAMENAYYVYHHCTLRRGINGPSDLFAHIPPDATKLYSFTMQGRGQVSLQQPVYQALSGVTVDRGDCLVHLVRMSSASNQGGIDAENQIFVLAQP